ncbi:MAG: ABC transporter ATP-binding protein [Candidatus Thermoplasmatota archaeon]
MIEKRFKCPGCNKTVIFTGELGENRVESCPSCGVKANIRFSKGVVRSDIKAIEVINLRKVYGDVVAVDGISFVVKKGEIFAFLGPNGAGKTTTVEIIESIRTPTSGVVKILGRDVQKEFNEVKELIGVLPQEYHSFERLTVRETLHYFSLLYKKRVDVDEILQMMDLKGYADKLYRNLSGGLKQRVGVALSLVNDPEIIFLDEPTTGLDPRARREVWGVIAGLKKRGKTIFLTTHYMEEAEYLADHIAIIHKGRIIAEGSLEELIGRYGGDVTMRIMGCKDSALAEEVLSDRGFRVIKGANGDLSVKIPYKEMVLEVLSDFRLACIEYDNIDIRRGNLEEVFLNLTGSRLSEEGVE